MDIELRGGNKQWWSIYQEGLEVTTSEIVGDSPTTHSAFLTMETKAGGKFWTVQQNRSRLTIRYGPIGSAGTTNEKLYDSVEKAYLQAKKMATDKKHEGYVFIAGKQPTDIVDDADISMRSLEEAMEIPIRIIGHWRYVDDHTADYVVKFVLERKQESTGWSFALLHQECCVHDGQFNRSAPREEDVPVVSGFDEERAKLVVKAMVDVMTKEGHGQPSKIKGQFKPPEGVKHHEVWQNVEIVVECGDQSLFSFSNR